MRKKLLAAVLATSMLGSSFSVFASETEATTANGTEVTTEAATEATTESITETAVEGETEEAVESSEENSTGWLHVDINGEPEEFELKFVTVGMTGKTYHFESDGYTMSFIFNKDLAVGETMSTNSIYQMDLLSSEEATKGYYFAKKTVKADVDSEVTLSQQTEDGLLEGTFKITVNSAERYVGDARPGIQEQLILENGEFSIQE